MDFFLSSELWRLLLRLLPHCAAIFPTLRDRACSLTATRRRIASLSIKAGLAGAGVS